MRPLALAALLLGALALTLLLSGCYVADQGLRYLALLSRARPAARVLADPESPPAERELLRRAAEIRDFARSKLGLRDTRNYRSLVSLPGTSLASVVQACAELSFERKLWSYPLVGRLPYRGYFEPRAAEREAARLRKAGLDVIVRPVDAFSTLGFLADPLWSFMASYSEAELAETLIHELCHATAFKRGAEAWNEELATFVGREGARAYLEARYGADSAELAELGRSRREAAAFAAWLKGSAALLEELYASGLGPEEKRRAKARIIAERAEEFRSRRGELFETEAYRDFPMEGINNAYLDLFRLYEGEEGLYREYFERVSGSALPAFLADMSRLAKARGDPKAAMRAALGERG